MAKRGNLWRVAGAMLALIAGIGLGKTLKHQDVVGSTPGSGNSSNGRISTDGEISADTMRRTRPRREVAHGISFSRTQWSKLMRDPALGRVPIMECLDATRRLEESIPVIDDVPLIGRMFDGSSQAGPDLAAQAEFFGWDERRTRQVSRALVQFGDDLAEAEKSGATVDYPDGEVVRFDLSANQAQRKEIAGNLREELAGILGQKDAERFAVLSMMDGLARDLPEIYEIEPPLWEPIVFHDPDAPDADRTVYDLSEQGGKSWHDGLDRRFRHLGIDIEWDRLLPKPSATVK